MKHQIKQVLWVGYSETLNRQSADKLGAAGYAVTGVASETAALAQIKQQQFGLFIIDERLVEMSGLEFCQVLRRCDAATPVLLLAQEVAKPSFFTALRSGAQLLMKKPLDSYDLIAVVTRLFCYAERRVQGRALGYALSTPPRNI
jgi:DNA-binding response OmpR family regulator